MIMQHEFFDDLFNPFSILSITTYVSSRLSKSYFFIKLHYGDGFYVVSKELEEASINDRIDRINAKNKLAEDINAFCIEHGEK